MRREDSERWKQMESWGAGEWNDGFGFCELENWGNSCSFLEAYSSSLEMIRLPLPFFLNHLLPIRAIRQPLKGGAAVVLSVVSNWVPRVRHCRDMHLALLQPLWLASVCKPAAAHNCEGSISQPSSLSLPHSHVFKP